MQQITIRVRLVSRAAIYGSMLHRHRIRKRKLIAGWAFLTALIVVSTTILQTYFTLKPPSYSLDQQSKSLVGDSRDDTTQYLTKNKQGTAFDFAVPASTDQAAKEHTGRLNDAYSASLSIYAREGITVTDTASKIAVTLTPQFYTTPGQKVEGDHIVYNAGSKRLVYTLKYNGLKEDIIIPEFQGNDLQFSFKLLLPSGVEARLDADGNIGIYSGDPALFGNISFGSDQDREKVDKARENGQKTNLIMTIPFPVVKDSTGKEYTDRASFRLGGKQTKKEKQVDNQLPPDAPKSLITTNTYDVTLTTKNLQALSYPISVDPTMQVTSSADFATINAEGGTEIDTANNLIRRQSLTGGSIGSFTTDSDLLPQSTYEAGAATYNGYIYLVGGTVSGGKNMQWAQIVNEATGDVGAWTTTTLTNPHFEVPGVVAYNGYLYVMGGSPSVGTNATTLVEYAKLNSDGSLSSNTCGTSVTWCSTSSLLKGEAGIHAVAHNGYIYTVGGCGNFAGQTCNNAASANDEAYRAPIKGNGELGIWTTAGMPNGGKLPNTLYRYKSGIWGDYYYVMGGISGGLSGTTQTAVYYARINSDGTMSGNASGAWMTTTPLPASRQGFAIGFSGGYVYVGSGVVGSSPSASVIYAAINADGTIGSWRDTGQIVENGGEREPAGIVLKNGFLVIAGNGGCITNECKKIQYAPFNRVGTPAHKTTGTTTTAGRWGSTGVVYNGWLYNIGGCSTTGVGAGELDDCNTPSAVVDAAQINADGSMGTWTTTGMDALTTGSAPGARWGAQAAVYNGWIYLSGGCTDGGSGACTRNNDVHKIQIANDGTLGTWSAEDSFTTARSEHYLAAVNDYLFIIAGADTNSTQLATVQRSAIASDGTIGAWSLVTTNLGSIYTSGINATNNVVVWHDRIYIVGPNVNTTATDDVYFINIDSSGNMDAAWTHTTDLPGALGFGGAGVYNGYLYAVQTGQVYFAPITASTGAVGSWATSSGASALATANIVVNGGYLYQFGGCGTFSAPVCSATASTATAYTVLHNGGSGKLTGWTTSSTATGKFGNAAAAYNGYLYSGGGCQLAAGGCSGLNDISTIQRAAINNDGTLGAWAATTQTMPPSNTYKVGYAMIIYKGYLYIAGGSNNSTTFNTAYSVLINADGNITAPWNTLPTFGSGINRTFMGSAVSGNVWYLAGGQDGSTVYNTVMYATLSGSGGLSSWTVGTGNQNLTTARHSMGFGANNGYLYAWGGCSNTVGSCTNGYTNDVEYTQINSSGGIDTAAGTWKSVKAGIGLGGFYGGSFIYNGYMYAVGGQNDGGNTQLTLYAPLLADGGVGQWQVVGQDSTAKLGVDRLWAGSTVYNGRAYITGGTTNFSASSVSTYIATLQSIPRVASLSKNYNFDVGVKPTKLITRGTKRSGSVVNANYMQPTRTGLTYVASFTVPNTTTDVIVSNGHGLAAGDMVVLYTNGTLPAPASMATTYYVIAANLTTNTFQISTTPGGTAVNFTNSGTGAHAYAFLPVMNTFSDIDFGGSSGGVATSLPADVTLTRNLFVHYSIDDTYSAVFPDSGNESTITDFDLYYTSNPGKRLRNGRTFTSGNDGKPADRGLQASP